MAIDVVPVDVLAQTRLWGDVDESLIVHRVDGRVQPGRRHVSIDERVQQPALVVEAGADHRSEDVEVADDAAVDLQVHAERLDGRRAA